jgi:hypothetical protein
MRSAVLSAAFFGAIAIAGCGGPSGGSPDSGHGGDMDVGPASDGGGGGHDAFSGGPVDAGPGVDGGCIPTFEICGDHIDQNCDHHDQSCGDNDMDGFDACRPTDAPDFSMCDCDDTDSNTYPARAGLAGAAEACDMKDNDCDGVIDESSACCTACTALGADGAQRADTCVGGGPGGTCVCSTEGAGDHACAPGETCCGDGCFNTMTDLNHCGSCQACTDQSDTCTAGICHCGAMSGACACNGVCTAGACGSCH